MKPATPRQRDLLVLIAEGKRNKEIAAQLGIGYESVKVYVSRLLKQYGAQSRTELAVKWADRRIR